MTTDERLDKLAERHQALAESLELAQHQHEEEMQELRAAIADVAEANHRTESTLRRAIELGVREVRNERRRRQAAIDDLTRLVAQIATAQLVTEEKLQRFIDSQRHNGGSKG